jgi:saccharopine dehydrogenase-like NADP-dependent oxidoreductase
MNVLLLGVGLQGKAALHDLVTSGVEKITAADLDLEALKGYCQFRGYDGRVRCERVEAADPESVGLLLARKPDVVIDLLPAKFVTQIAQQAVKHKVHLVNTYYVTPEMRILAEEAVRSGITVLPEFGMDPGLDLVCLGHTVRCLDSLESLASYGAGFPEPKAANNAIKYKVTWTFAGVLNSYLRPGRFIRDGKIVEVDARRMFAPEYLHTLNLEDLGELEAFPNGDALKYLELLNLSSKEVKNMGRFVLRWPGHSAFWRTLVDLNMLDEGSVEVDGVPVNRRNFLQASMEPLLQYGPGERDVAVIRIDAVGMKDGKKTRVVTSCTDYRDLETGFTAMTRTVGFTTSIGAQMILKGDIAKPGILTPVRDVPFVRFAEELRQRGIQVSTHAYPVS